jgi:hypothetical protein
MKPREAKNDLVNWCTGDEEGDVFLMSGLHSEGEWLSDVGDGSGPKRPTIQDLNRERRGEQV